MQGAQVLPERQQPAKRRKTSGPALAPHAQSSPQPEQPMLLMAPLPERPAQPSSAARPVARPLDALVSSAGSLPVLGHHQCLIDTHAAVCSSHTQ